MWNILYIVRIKNSKKMSLLTIKIFILGFVNFITKEINYSDLNCGEIKKKKKMSIYLRQLNRWC